jgi:aspartate/methionine/tyrosine aminotransferase
MNLADRTTIKEYVFARLAKQVAKVEEQTGRKVLNLGVGSPDVSPSSIYIQKVQEFYAESKNHLYPGYGANQEFIKAIQSWHKIRFATELEADQCTIVNGSKDAVSHLNMSILNPGDEALVPDPGYPGFSGTIELIGAKSVYYDLVGKNGFKPDLAQLQSLVTAKTKLIWLNFPSNPTGQIATRNELQSYVDFAVKNKIWLLYDNAYSEIYFGHDKPLSILEISGANEVAVELHSFSKSFSFAGYRMGWVVGNAQLIKGLEVIKSQVDSGMSLPLQKLGTYALLNPDYDWLENIRKTYVQRQIIIADYLQKLGLTFELPQASLYIWAKIPEKYSDAEEYSSEVLTTKQILLTPGTAFGKNGSRYIRASICSDISNLQDY